MVDPANLVPFGWFMSLIISPYYTNVTILALAAALLGRFFTREAVDVEAR
jgi:hypothetical protein